MIFAWFSPFVVVPMAARLKELKRLKGLKEFKVERVKGKVAERGGIVHQLSMSNKRQCHQ